MRYNVILFLILLSLSNTLEAQKEMQYTVAAREVNGVFVASDQVFTVLVTTSKTDQIRVNAKVEGETFESVLLDISIKEGLWYIQTKRALGFKQIDDKLAAHKVISIVLEIEMPEDKELWVKSNLASVRLNGSCAYVNLNLSGGECVLNNFSGSGVVNTLRGDITVNTDQASISAKTRNGNLTIENNTTRKPQLKLRSIDGNISVSKSE